MLDSAISQKEEPFPPREWIERSYHIQRWTEIPNGGHFAAAEEPELLTRDVRDFFRLLRAEIQKSDFGE